MFLLAEQMNLLFVFFEPVVCFSCDILFGCLFVCWALYFMLDTCAPTCCREVTHPRQNNAVFRETQPDPGGPIGQKFLNPWCYVFWRSDITSCHPDEKQEMKWMKGYFDQTVTDQYLFNCWDFSSQSVFYCKIWTLDLLYAGVIEPNWSGPVYPELWAYPIMHWAHQYHLSDSDWLAFFLSQVWTISQHLCFFMKLEAEQHLDGSVYWAPGFLVGGAVGGPRGRSDCFMGKNESTNVNRGTAVTPVLVIWFLSGHVLQSMMSQPEMCVVLQSVSLIN